MQEKIFVTGVGIVSAIGLNAREVLDSMKKLKTGIGKNNNVDTIYKDEIPVAEIKRSNAELFEIAHIHEKGIYSRTALLGIIAAGQALEHAGITNTDPFKTGIISATSVGGMDRTPYFYKEFIKNNRKGRLRDVISHDCGDNAEKIASLFGIRDFISTISTACSSSANSIMYGARLIRQGIIERALVGGTDALSLFTINGFNSLMILDRELCKPFDEERNGLNLGEGSGFLVIESERAVNKEKKKVLCEVRGYGNACDAYHQTASSPDGKGAYLSMIKALDSAGLSPEDIDYVNAHGTGTKNNDLSEGIAVNRIFGSNIPPISSTKSFTGHTLGASGAIEAVLSILAIQNQCVYPNLNFKTRMNELSFSPVTQYSENVKIRNIMSNSFGFGGNNSTLIFSTC